MILLLRVLALLLHAGLILALAPTLTGLRRSLGARLQGRAAPSLLQPWHELRRLTRKQPVLPEHMSPLLAHMPIAVFACSFGAALLVPGFSLGMLTAPAADLLVVAGLLALSRALLGLAALEAGTAPPGQCAAHVLGRAALAEPALLLAVFALALATGTTNLDAIAAALRDTPLAAPLALGLLAALALSPDRAALAREFSGRHLALLRAADGVRLVVWLSLIADLLPWGIGAVEFPAQFWLLGMLVWAVKLGVLTTALAVPLLRPRATWLPGWAGAALLLALLTAVILIGRGLA